MGKRSARLLVGRYNLYLTPRELARLGQLYLQQGMWEGESLIPSEWIRDAVQPKVPVDSTRNYGHLWHLPALLGQPVYKMWGFGGQFVYVVPNQNLVVVLTADTKDEHTEMNGDTFSRSTCCRRFVSLLPSPHLLS